MVTEQVIEFTAAVKVTINDPDVIEGVTGPNGDKWRAQFYDLHDEEDVLAHLAYNCIANGCESAAMLDGWADLPADAVQMERIGGFEFLRAESAREQSNGDRAE